MLIGSSKNKNKIVEKKLIKKIRWWWGTKLLKTRRSTQVMTILCSNDEKKLSYAWIVSLNKTTVLSRLYRCLSVTRGHWHITLCLKSKINLREFILLQIYAKTDVIYTEFDNKSLSFLRLKSYLFSKKFVRFFGVKFNIHEYTVNSFDKNKSLQLQT